MAGKGGGGAWKVAYADFVTAMMAFFLVMWISSQDQKLKEAVANYFVDPMGYYTVGTSNRQGGTGAIMEGSGVGTVPNGSKQTVGRGRMAQTDNGTMAYVTKTVSDWVLSDGEWYEQFRQLATQAREEAARSYEVVVDKANPDDVAVSLLASKIRQQIAAKAPDPDGLYGDLIQDALETVQWHEIADEVLSP